MYSIVEKKQSYSFTVQVAIIGAGGCGLTAALASADSGAETLVFEKTKTPLGTTAMSTGLIPAAGLKQQADQGIADSADVFAEDILRKNKYSANSDIVHTLAQMSGETIRWLRDIHAIPLSLVEGFTYPGHSHRRMYGTPNRTGSELMATLENAVAKIDVDIITEAEVTSLHVDDEKRITGLSYQRPDGLIEDIGCKAVILASCGFAGSAEKVSQYIPEMRNAVLHTHPENKGAAIDWAAGLGAGLKDMQGYQGHAGLALGHGIPILWPTIMAGGFQLNQEGVRFSDETQGYSEQANTVLAQTDALAWTVFDHRIYTIMEQFEDFQDAIAAKAIVKSDTRDELAGLTRLPQAALEASFSHIEALCASGDVDEFGRVFASKDNLSPPYYAARVTGALFHTQGGVDIDTQARVLDEEGRPFPNLFAGGGAARGISGPTAAGYLAGNGLLTATSLGKIAGHSAAKIAMDQAD